MAVQFKKAKKVAAKGRVALIGPAGSGKSYTMLTLATVLAQGGKVAAVDSEHGSLSKYADIFDFDVFEMDSFSPKNFLEALTEAEKGGYAVFCCDSLSHFWTGKDGALEFVDLASKRSRDGMSGWKEFRPHEREMVDRMIASPCHVIVTMRTKTEYSEVEENGKKKRVKVGLAPVQRDGLEYEFDLVSYMDDECNFVVDKTRCPRYSGKIIPKPKSSDFAPFHEWLSGGEAPERKTPPRPAAEKTEKEGQAQAEKKATPQSDEYVSSDNADRLFRLATEAKVDMKAMGRHLASLGYRKREDASAWASIRESHVESLEQWIEQNRA